MTSSSGSVALPLRLTSEPSWTVWAGPASTDGGLLTGAVTVMITESEDVAVPSSAVSVSVKMMAVRVDPGSGKGGRCRGVIGQCNVR